MIRHALAFIPLRRNEVLMVTTGYDETLNDSKIYHAV